MMNWHNSDRQIYRRRRRFLSKETYYIWQGIRIEKMKQNKFFDTNYFVKKKERKH